MKLIVTIELTDEQCREIVRRGTVTPQWPQRPPRTPITKRQRYLCKLARDNGYEDAARFIEGFINTRGYRTGYDKIVQTDWPEFGALVPEWQ
jgi:hypothetical protein